MKPENKATLPKQVRSNGPVHFFKVLGSKIKGLFQPEEVEVTFKVEGNKTSYTYTKVVHKQVA